MKIDCPSCKGNGTINFDIVGTIKKRCSVCEGEGSMVCLTEKAFKNINEKASNYDKVNEGVLLKSMDHCRFEYQCDCGNILIKSEIQNFCPSCGFVIFIP